jgi:hypothetical protein
MIRMGDDAHGAILDGPAIMVALCLSPGTNSCTCACHLQQNLLDDNKIIIES